MVKGKQNNDTRVRTTHFILTIFAGFLLFVLLASFWSWLKNSPVVFVRKTLVREWNFQRPTFSSYPIRINNESVPQISAKAAVVIDPDAEITLFAKNANLKLPPASLTKLATGLVAVKNCPLGKVIPVTGTKVDGTKAGLITGDLITVEGLLYALLLPSGNDAAQLLSLNCANKNEQFTDSMNWLASQLSMYNTHFSNPTGLDAKDQYSTAFDLLKLAKATIDNVELASIVSAKEVSFDSAPKNHEYHFVNLNRLLTKTRGVLGIKTGTSEAAGENLITLVNRENRRIITVVLGSQDRFGDSQRIIEWVYDNYDWISF